MLQNFIRIKMLYFVFVSCLHLADSNLAPFITKCKQDDMKCWMEEMRKTIPLFGDGIPELNVHKMDPLKIKHVDASTANLKFSISDASITGLKNCETKKVSRDFQNAQLFAELLCTCTLDGKYDMDGNLFVVPIKGNGNVHAVIRKIALTVRVDYTEVVDSKGKKHWNITSWNHEFTLKDKSDVSFENLFPDNELLRKTANDLITNSGNEVVLEIGQPVIKAIAGKVVRGVQNFFEAVPLEDLTLD